jgi:hypothetical protein
MKQISPLSASAKASAFRGVRGEILDNSAYNLRFLLPRSSDKMSPSSKKQIAPFQKRARKVMQLGRIASLA